MGIERSQKSGDGRNDAGSRPEGKRLLRRVLDRDWGHSARKEKESLPQDDVQVKFSREHASSNAPLWQQIGQDASLVAGEQSLLHLRESAKKGKPDKGEISVYERIHKLQEALALEAVSAYGVDKESVYTDGAGVSLDFDYHNTRIRVQPSEHMVTVKTWDAALSFQEQNDVERRYESEIRPREVKDAIMQQYLDSAGEPHYLDEVADVIYENMDGITAEGRQLDTTVYNFRRRNNFREITLDTSSVTFGIPIAMELATAPFDEVYPILQRGRLAVPEPGVFQSKGDIWGLNEQGKIVKQEN